MDEKRDFVMVTVSGPDQPGITSAFSKILVDNQVEIVDIEQASLQDFLGLSFLLDMSGAKQSKDGVLKDLLFEASRLRLTLNFRLFSEKEMKARNNKNLFVLTYFGDTRALLEISNILAEENANIEMISNLTRHCASCVELTIDVNGVKNLSHLKERVLAKSHELNIDLALQKMEAYRKNKRLVFFDMDSTLVDMELIDEMAHRAGVFKEVSRITEKARRGDIDFEEALIQRVALLKGLKVEELERIRNKMKLSAGAEDLVETLKGLGYKLGLVSGGFDYFANFLKERLGLDFSFANQLEIKNGALTGKVLGKIVDNTYKAKIVNMVSSEEGVLLDQTVAIGDGANDVLMLGQAGLGIAYNAKEKLERAANMSLGRARLKNILYILGISEEEMGSWNVCDRPV
ncbi:MAG: phosphoserine phosphatase SerB [Deltaproteobacteria bacterium CG03_land_8_20_14_0_80_45_14]|jgi:phosphoserine phosphatase|nr:MAG: phosphoserine phosphatase SerB [Deltaproteobacteria bacterium CG03_land_8_20_14_0_80_45_14]